MPTAGFCSQCHRYVWVQANGGCSFGHGADSLRDLHDANSLPGYDDEIVEAPVPVASASSAAPPDDIPLGYPPPPSDDWASPPQQLELTGLPAGVPRFNWGAFLLPFFWAIAYGLPEFALLVGIVWGAEAYFMFRIHNLQLAQAVSLVELAVYVAIGFLGPRTYWRRRPNKLTVAEYNRKQTKWLLIGLGFFGLAIVFALMGA